MADTRHMSTLGKLKTPEKKPSAKAAPLKRPAAPPAVPDDPSRPRSVSPEAWLGVPEPRRDEVRRKAAVYVRCGYHPDDAVRKALSEADAASVQ